MSKCRKGCAAAGTWAALSWSSRPVMAQLDSACPPPSLTSRLHSQPSAGVGEHVGPAHSQEEEPLQAAHLSLVE